MLETAFWKSAAGSLPPRYTFDLQWAERIDGVVGTVVDACRRAKSALRRWFDAPAMKPRTDL